MARTTRDTISGFFLAILLSCLGFMCAQQSYSKTKSYKLSETNIYASYELMKDIYKTLLAKHKDPPRLNYNKDNGRVEYDQCEGSNDFNMSISKEISLKASMVQEAAFHFAQVEMGLDQINYPRDIWKPIIERYARKELNNNGTDYEPDVFKELNKHSGELVDGRKLPKFVDVSGCGAGGTSVVFKPKSNGSQIWIIPEFDYLVCEKRRDSDVDPDDPKSCDQWGMASDGQYHIVSGYYFVRVFSNGSPSRLIPWRAPSDEGDHIAKF